MRSALFVVMLITGFALAACSAGGLGTSSDNPYAPSRAPNKNAVDGLVVGHRLMAAGEYELAYDAFIRAAADQGMTADVQSALGTANLGLGRLGQAEKLLRDAIELDPTRPEIWNNLGVVLMERDKNAEAEQVFRKAYALDNGQSDSIRDNLRLALAKTNNSAYDGSKQDYKLVRRGSSDYVIRQTP